MRDQLKEAAKASGRSMNAEIVARLEDYPRITLLEIAVTRSDQVERELRAEIDALRNENRENFGRANVYEKRLMVAEAEQKTLQKQVTHYQRVNEDLTRLITSAAKKEVEADDSQKLANMIQAMQDQVEELSKERDDDREATQKLLDDQSAMIKDLLRTNKMTLDVLERFQEAFLTAASGDDTDLKSIMREFGKAPK